MEQNILQKICAAKAGYVEKRQKQVPLEKLKEKAANAGKPRGFADAIKRKITSGQNAIIAEVKKASPSKGLIRADFDPVNIAGIYEKSGAACISVLTDYDYFQGKDEYLEAVKQAVKLPVLRKDFMLEPYQIYESRALEADCVLLIVAALDEKKLLELEQTALELGMDVLIEVHNRAELELALTMQSRLIGINNRDLKTLKVDMATTETLANIIPEGYITICESGIKTHSDIERANRAGVRAFLVGQSLMEQEDIALALENLLGEGRK